MINIIFLLLSLAGPASAQAPQGSDVLVAVNGFPIKRDDVTNRLWNVHAAEVLNQMVDDVLAEQVAAGFESKAGKKDKDAWKKEADARLQGVKSQFKGEAAFTENLSKSGLSLDVLRRQIWTQLVREKLMISALGLSATPAEVRAFFEANKEKLGGGDSARLRHIVVSTEQQARDLLVSIRVGADFSGLAQQLSLDTGSKEKGGDLGFISRGMLAPEIENVVFSLKSGQVSPVVKTQQGFHLFKVEERREAKPASFQQMEKDLTRTVLAQKINQAWPLYLKELRRTADIRTATGPGAATPASGRP